MASTNDLRSWFQFKTDYGLIEIRAGSEVEARESLKCLLMELMELTQAVTDAFDRWDARRVDVGRKGKKASEYH